MFFFIYFLWQLYRWEIIQCINCGHQGTATNMLGTKTAFECALLFYFQFHFRDWRSHGLYRAAVHRCLSVVRRIGKSFTIVLSVTSPYSVSVCGKWTFMYCNRLLACAICPFSAAVLNFSPRIPPLCTLCTFLLTLQMFVLFDFKCPVK